MGAVLATVGRPERLRPFVEAVLSDAGVLELVVVVDGPDPSSVLVLEELAASEPRLRVLPVSQRGQLAALDAGVRASRADVVVLLDDDVLPAHDTLTAHLRHHRRAAGLVVVGSMPVEASEDGPSRGTRLYAADYRKHVESVRRGDVQVLDALWTGNWSMRRADCLRVGLANPRFPAHYHADWDLGFRLADAGLTGLFDPDVAAVHLHRRTDDEFLRDSARQGAGRVALHRAHPERLAPFRFHQLIESLSAPLQLLVAACGSTPAGPAVARGLMRLAEPWERATTRLGRGDPLAPAKVARRIMHWHGARKALAAPSDPVPAGTAQPPPSG